MRRIPSIFGASNHIHRNIPNDAFMDLEVIKQHLPELLDLRELLLHLDYEDTEGKCLLKEATETFIPIYIKFKLGSISSDIPADIATKINALTQEDYLACLKDFTNTCDLAPQIKDGYICLPVPLSWAMNCTEGQIFKINMNYPLKELSIDQTSNPKSITYSGGYDYYTSSVKPVIDFSVQVVQVSGSGSDTSVNIYNKFEINIDFYCENQSIEKYINGDNNPVVTFKRYYPFIPGSLGTGLDLTPVAFTKLVRNEE